MTLVGALGNNARATVDRHGRVQPHGVRWALDWWIGADDRWRVPTGEVAVRQSRVDGMPVVRTALRVPGGDAVQRVYATGDGAIVVDVENDSPAPFVLAFVVAAARSVAVDHDVVIVDGLPVLHTPRPARRWAAGSHDAVRDAVVGGAASDGPFPAIRERGVAAAFLHPVAHRTTLRAVLGSAGGREPPSAEAVAQGWRAQLQRGMRVDLPDPGLAAAVDGARAQLALAAETRSDPEMMAALEDWGLDAEAELAWRRLSMRDRWRARRLARRPGVAEVWPSPGDDAAFLRVLRDLLVREAPDGVELLRILPEEWRGRSLEVHDAPVRSGHVSYAVRWHGPRPALLWEAPAGITLRAPGLDPNWSTTEDAGEVLFGAERPPVVPQE